MKYFSSTTMISIIMSLLFFSYAYREYSLSYRVSYWALGIGGFILLAGLVYAWWRNREI